MVLDYARLSKNEESALDAYDGMRYELSDGKGNVIEIRDTRTLDGTYLISKKFLKIKCCEVYSEEFPQHKIDAARMGTLDDEQETKEILALDEKMKREYKLRKLMMDEAKKLGNMDLIEEFALSEEWRVIESKTSIGKHELAKKNGNEIKSLLIE